MSSLAILLSPTYQVYDASLERPYCLNYTNASGELAATRFTYDRKGRLSKAFYQQISGSRSSVNEHDLNKAGQVIAKRRTFNDGMTSVETFTFSKDGRLETESYEDSKGLKGSITYTYTPQGQAQGMVADNGKGWFTGQITFTLDPEGRRKEGRIESPEGTTGNITYLYEEGHLFREHWVMGNWNQTFQTVYETL